MADSIQTHPHAVTGDEPASRAAASQALFDAAARVTRHHLVKLDDRMRRQQASQDRERPGAGAGRRDR